MVGLGFFLNRVIVIEEAISHMTRLYGWILLSVTVLVGCVALSASDGQADAVENILKRFPGSHLLSLQERGSDVRDFFVQHFPKDNPSLIRADFNGDGYPDYALLLRDDKSGTTKLVVLLCSANGQCKSAYQLDESAYAGSVYLRPASLGSQVSQTDAINGNDHNSRIKLHSTGVQVTYFEKGKVVLYWNRKHQKIEELQTED